MAICPRSGTSVHNVGQHLHMEIYGASHLTDVDYIQKACEDASIATRAPRSLHPIFIISAASMA